MRVHTWTWSAHVLTPLHKTSSLLESNPESSAVPLKDWKSEQGKVRRVMEESDKRLLLTLGSVYVWLSALNASCPALTWKHLSACVNTLSVWQTDSGHLKSSSFIWVVLCSNSLLKMFFFFCHNSTGNLICCLTSYDTYTHTLQVDYFVTWIA